MNYHTVYWRNTLADLLRSSTLKRLDVRRKAAFDAAPEVIEGAAWRDPERVDDWAGEYAGKDDVAHFFQALGTAVDVASHPVTALVAQGDVVVATGDVSFNVRETGKAGSSKWVYIWKLANGRVHSYEQFNDAGLAEAFS